MRDEKADLTDAEPPLVAQWRTFGCHVDDAVTERAAATTMTSSAYEHAASALWLLSLAAHKTEFMQSVAQLFIQFVGQYRTLMAQQATSAAASIQQLRARAEAVRQWAETATRASRNGVTTLDKTVVDLIARRTARAEQEVAEQHRRSARALELELRRSLHLVLDAAAPDTLRALCTQSTRSVTEDTNGTRTVMKHVQALSSSVTDDKSLHVSSFVHAARSNGAVPSVRTVSLPNPLATSGRHAVAGEAGVMPRILLDVSPLSLLPQCLASCWQVQQLQQEEDDNTAERSSGGGAAAAATVAQLQRLARGRHSMLLLIGGQDAAAALLEPLCAPELLLLPGETDSTNDDFQPLPCCPALRVRFTTSLWGGNVVLHYAPPVVTASATKDSVTCSIMDEVLRLALAWNVDMLSVAVLEATRQAATTSAAAAHTTLPSLVVDTLRQLQYAIARLLVSAAGTRFLRVYTIDDTLLRRIAQGEAGKQAADLAEPPLAAASRVAGATEAVQKDESDRNTRRRRRSLTASPPRERASSPLGHAAGPVFNTPIAVRLFVPLDADVLRDNVGPDAHISDAAALASLQTTPKKAATRQRGTSAALASHKTKNGSRRPAVPDRPVVTHGTAAPSRTDRARSASSAQTAAVDTLQGVLSRALGDAVELL